MPTKTIETNPEREALEAVCPHLAVAIALTIGNGHIVQRGDVLGVITASGLARRRSRTNAAGTGFADNSPTGQVDDASVFKAGDVLKDAAGNAIGTVLSVDPTTSPDTVTLTGNSASNVAAGVGVVAQDGSQVAKAVSDKGSDGVGDTPINVFIGGYLTESKLRGLDASAKSELAGASVAGGVFKF